MNAVAVPQSVESMEIGDPVDARNSFARIVVELIALAGDQPVEPNSLEPAALVLSHHGLLDCNDMTFGCDYDLSIRSFELRDGYVRALDAGLIVLDGPHVRVGEHHHFDLLPEQGEASDLARSVFSQSRSDLQRTAQHLILGE